MSLVQSEIQPPSKHSSCVISVVKESTYTDPDVNITTNTNTNTKIDTNNNSKSGDGSHNHSCSSNISLSDASTVTCNQSIVQSFANDGSYGREVLRLPSTAPSECTAALFFSSSSSRDIEVDQQPKKSVFASPTIRSLVALPPSLRDQQQQQLDSASIRTASTLLAESPVPPLTPDNCSVCDDCADEERTRALKLALEFKTIRNLKPEHDSVRARFFLHQAKQTESLRDDQDGRRKRLLESHRSSVEALEEQVSSLSLSDLSSLLQLQSLSSENVEKLTFTPIACQ